LRALRKDDLERQLKALEQAAKDLLQIDAQLTQLIIKPKHIEDIDELERKIATLDAQLSAAAAHLNIEVKPAGKGQVRVGTAQPDQTYNGPVVAETKVTVGELAIITVTPAPNASHETRQSLDADRVSLLASIGVASSAEARALLSKRRDLEAGRKGVVTELKSLNVTGDPTPVIAKTKSGLAETDAAISSALADAKRQTLPSNSQIEEEKLELGRQRAAINARRASFEETLGQQQDALEGAVVIRSGTESKLELIRKSIDDDTAICPDAERLRTSAKASSTVSQRSFSRSGP